MTRQMKWAKLELKRLRAERLCCEECNALFKLEFAHIKKTLLNGSGRGLKQRVLDIRNNPNCYRLLCRDCHEELDYGS